MLCGVPRHGAPRGDLRGARREALGLAAIEKLVRQRKIARDESVVLFNTGSGYKYLEAWQAALASKATPDSLYRVA